MLLESIQLENVGVFAGTQHLDLTVKNARKPVVLIGGLNGCGKTTLLESILLALYGKLSPSARTAGISYENYLEALMTTGAGGPSAIELVFRVHESGREDRYIIRRTWARASKKVREDLEVWLNGCYDELLSQNWAEAVDRFLPQRLAGLFLFDGEKIAKLADPRQAPRILQTAINSLLGVELVEQLESDLTTIIRRKSKELIPDADRSAIEIIESRLDELQKSLTAARSEAASLQTTHDRVREQLDRAQEDFAEHGGEFAGQRTVLVQERSQLESRLEAIREELRALAAGPLPLALIRDQLASLLQDLDARPLHGDPLAIRQWLDQRHKRVLSKAAELGLDDSAISLVREAIEDDIATVLDSLSGPESVSLSAAGSSRLRALLGGVLDDAVGQGRRLLVEFDAATNRLMTVERLLGGMPSEDDLAVLVKRLKNLESELSAARYALNANATQRELITKEIESVEGHRQREWSKFRGNENDQSDLHRFLRHSEQAQSVLGIFRTRLVAQHTQRLEEFILEGYQQLLRKDGLIRSISIDPSTCEIEIRGRHDQILDLERLSAGERQLLATAMLWGLARAAGRPLPVIIDTPLARLDSAHKTHFVGRYLPKASHQVIVLSTDSEIHGAYYDLLKSAVCSEYLLAHDDSTGSTEILHGYFDKEFTYVA